MRRGGFAPGLLALAMAAACGHAPPREEPQSPRAAADLDAAPSPEAGIEPQPWVSPRAYRHYLAALLARDRDDHGTAAVELHEALVFDPDSAHLRTLYAQELARLGRMNEAREEAETALKRSPDHAPAHLLLARIAVNEERLDDARGQFRAAIHGEPDDGDAYRDLLHLEVSTGNLPAARAVLENLEAVAREHTLDAEGADNDVTGEEAVTGSRLRENASSGWVELGSAFAARHADSEADEAFARAERIDPGTGDGLLARASYLEGRRRFGEARVLYLRLVARRPESPGVLASLSRVSLQEGQPDVAEAHLRKLVQLAGEMDGEGQDRDADRRELTAALFRAALPLLGANRVEAAQAAFEACLRLFPAHPELSFYRALAIDSRGNHREAAQLFEALDGALADGSESRAEADRSAQRGPSFLAGEPATIVVDARTQAALSRSRLGEHAEGAKRMRALFAERPQDEAVGLGLIEALERDGHLVDAVSILAAAARAQPRSEAILFALASAQDRAGKQQSAFGTMRKVLALSPHHAGALNYVGYSLVEKHESLEEAERLLAEAVDQRPDDGAVADSYGTCLLRRGKVPAALAELSRAQNLSPGDPVILEHLGEALLASGKREEAGSAFRKALAVLEPSVGRSRKAREGRDPEPSDARVRAEILQKLRTLTPR
ncbi:MAG: tetratricopeptide repeat protein [Deltaproteobacteria bacterium]|nr:MAG: tetratricopeptide repeat protein [Deltaproteobacteria bacterium]TMB34882.1 MAG: tetratricopeptide repeat protein [Deltaproteobacteria bacterium]